jgi:hypothetical protein
VERFYFKKIAVLIHNARKSADTRMADLRCVQRAVRNAVHACTHAASAFDFLRTWRRSILLDHSGDHAEAPVGDQVAAIARTMVRFSSGAMIAGRHGEFWSLRLLPPSAPRLVSVSGFEG